MREGPRGGMRRIVWILVGIALGLMVGLCAGCGEAPGRGADGAGAEGTDAVPVTVIEDCREPCLEVVLEPVATIGRADDPVLPRLMTQLAAGPGYVAAGMLAEPGVVGLYDAAGEMIDVIGRFAARRAAWFPPGDNREPDPKYPAVSQLSLDPRGRIWAIVMRPTGDYRDAFDGYGPESYSVASFDRIRDSVIEVLDPAAGRVVARGRFPQARMRFLPGSDRLYTARQDSLGYVYFDVLAPEIRG